MNDHGAHPRDSRGTPPTVIVCADPDFITSNPSLVGEPPLEIVVARHIATAIYGNIGAANRLDFTVIGPAVNLVSRIEAVAKTLNLPIVVSADFARAYGQSLHPLGRHELRGLATPHDLFAPILPSVRI